MYLSYSTALTADFIAIYTPGFSDMIRRSCDSTLITWSMASQYTPTVAKIKTGESSAVGSETVSWTVRETFGWQGKLNGKRHKCNEARIPTNAFYLKRKALSRGKRRHATAWFWRHRFSIIKLFPNLVNNCWLWWTMRVVLTNQKQENILNE